MLVNWGEVINNHPRSTFTFLDATDGSVVGKTLQENRLYGTLSHPAIAMNAAGSKVYYLTTNTNTKYTSFIGLDFDGSDWTRFA